MSKEQGLLPYYLKLYTFVKVLWIALEHIFRQKRSIPKAYLFLVGLLSVSRIFLLKKLTISTIYFLIGLTFLMECLIFIYLRKYLGLMRSCLEIGPCFLTIGCMLYLYPYYLLDIKQI